jgi:rfaE bifunctional protein kinase chain/domain
VIASLLNTFPGTSVLAVGDAMLDEYVWGEVERISPEAPVPVVDVVRKTTSPGGVANVAAGVAALEGRPRVCAVVGDDDAGRILLGRLEELGVDVEGVVVDPSRPTTTKTRVIAHSQQVLRTDVEDRSPIEAAIERRLVDFASGAVSGAGAVLVSDYAKGVASDGVVRAVIGEARRQGKPVVVDPKGYDYAKYKGATLLTPNARDAAQAAAVQLRTYDDLALAASRLADLTEGALLLITRGAEGMTLFDSDGPVDIAAEAREVYDVTGAGDTVAAVLSMALGNSAPLKEAMRIANVAAGITVGKVGTSTVALDELRRALGSAPAGN